MSHRSRPTRSVFSKRPGTCGSGSKTASRRATSELRPTGPPGYGPIARTAFCAAGRGLRDHAPNDPPRASSEHPTCNSIHSALCVLTNEKRTHPDRPAPPEYKPLAAIFPVSSFLQEIASGQNLTLDSQGQRAGVDPLRLSPVPSCCSRSCLGKGPSAVGWLFPHNDPGDDSEPPGPRLTAVVYSAA
jgi:hypothetical protein